jgi:hypothetical protein
MSRLLYQLSYGPAMRGSITLRKTSRVVKAAWRHPVCLQALSTKLRSILLRLGWRSLRSAFASICRTRSRVTSKS